MNKLRNTKCDVSKDLFFMLYGEKGNAKTAPLASLRGEGFGSFLCDARQD